MGFTKLDSGIVDSSVWSEPLATRVVWVTMLAKCDHTGMVRCARSGLLRASNVSQEDFDLAIAALESPDPESRTKDDEGRRIRPVEGGWFVINHGEYRKRSYSNNPESERKRRYRGRVGHVPLCHENVRDISASASVSGSSPNPEEEIRYNTNPSEEWLEKGSSSLREIFSKFNALPMLEKDGLLDFLLSLTWENRDLNCAEAIEEKLTRWIKRPPKPDADLFTEFRRWFKLERKFDLERARRTRVGSHK
jgi:hypothetical protein